MDEDSPSHCPWDPTMVCACQRPRLPGGCPSQWPNAARILTDPLLGPWDPGAPILWLWLQSPQGLCQTSLNCSGCFYTNFPASHLHWRADSPRVSGFLPTFSPARAFPLIKSLHSWPLFICFSKVPDWHHPQAISPWVPRPCLCWLPVYFQHWVQWCQMHTVGLMNESINALFVKEPRIQNLLLILCLLLSATFVYMKHQLHSWGRHGVRAGSQWLAGHHRSQWIPVCVTLQREWCINFYE